MNEDMIRKFSEEISKDPSLALRLVRQFELSKFKEEHKVERASPLKCPSCAALIPSPGTLWGPSKGTNNIFVCRKCKLEWDIKCLSEPNETLLERLKETLKSNDYRR